MKIKTILPKTFFGRSLAIILIPMLILQFVLIYVFYERHWEDVGRRLALALGGQISYIIEEISINNYNELQISRSFNRGKEYFLLESKIHLDKTIKDFTQHKISSLLDNTLLNSLKERIKYNYKFDTKTIKNTVILFVEVENGVIEFSVPRKTLYSSTIEVFMGFMLITALLLFILALHFMRQQIKPLKNIMLAAEEFGKGNNNFELKPRGAFELKLLSEVFIKMRERIKNQIEQRTEMLAGIGHDLRTPLTRMKLQIALLKDKSAVDSLTEDVSEMRGMIEAYLAFAKGEEEEKIRNINLKEFIKKILKRNNFDNRLEIKTFIKENDIISVRPIAFNRVILNILSNAAQYAHKKVHISRDFHMKNNILLIEDDGPGIPQNKRKEVFLAFHRLDKSRFTKYGRTGLGLTIAKNIIKGHGGDILLGKSNLGGLKVEVTFPA
ncbi:MAG: two-component sensor histidine kinase [Rickettsiales bacterium]|nr:two-component sensor histidine kinase [Rickettsiales bacterium]